MTYEDFFEFNKNLADKEFTKWETIAKDSTQIHQLALHLPVLIGITNNVGYLRGQDSCYLDFRDPSPQQKHFYDTENEFEDRLKKLIDIVLQSKEKDFYEKRLNSYFLLFRTNQHGDVWA